jgi:cytochrome bd ubiquinol oxidase subunit II
VVGRRTRRPRWQSLRGISRNWVLCFVGAVPSLLVGVAVGNLFLGIPFYLDAASRAFYTGGAHNFFSPFALLCGVVSLTMMILNGACYAARKTSGDVMQRAAHTGIVAAGLFVIAFVAAGLTVVFCLEGYRIIGDIQAAASHPHTIAISHSPGAWLDNYIMRPWLWSAPLTALIGALLACWSLLVRWTRVASVASYFVVVGTMLTAAFALLPFLIPSSDYPDQSLLVSDTASSLSRLPGMVIAAILLLPCAAAYTCWVFRALQRCITSEASRELC